VKVEEILSVSVPGGKVTEEGVRVNINVALQYLNSWLMVIKHIYSVTVGLKKTQGLFFWEKHYCLVVVCKPDVDNFLPKASQPVSNLKNSVVCCWK